MTEKKHVTDRKNHINMTIKFDGTEKISSHRRYHITGHNKPSRWKKSKEDNKFSPLSRNYWDVSSNEVKFAGKLTVEAQSWGFRKNITKLITKRENIKLLLGMDWLRQVIWTIWNIESLTTFTDHSEGDKNIQNLNSYSRRTEQIQMPRLKYN